MVLYGIISYCLYWNLSAFMNIRIFVYLNTPVAEARWVFGRINVYLEYLQHIISIYV